MGRHLRRQAAQTARTRNLGDDKKKTVVAATRPAGTLYKQGTTKDVVNFDRTNDRMAKYVRYTLEPLASKAARTLKRPVSTIWEKPKRKDQLVAPALVDGEAPNRDRGNRQIQFGQQQEQPGVDAEGWRLTMNVYMKIMRTT